MFNDENPLFKRNCFILTDSSTFQRTTIDKNLGGRYFQGSVKPQYQTVHELLIEDRNLPLQEQFFSLREFSQVRS